MLKISQTTVDGFARAQEERFRCRAIDYAERTFAVTDRASLLRVFQESDAAALDYDLQSERARLAMFVLAVQAGAAVLRRPDIAAILGQDDAPERVRLRLLIDQFKAVA